MRAALKQMSQPTFHANACTHRYSPMLPATRTASQKLSRSRFLRAGAPRSDYFTDCFSDSAPQATRTDCFTDCNSDFCGQVAPVRLIYRLQRRLLLRSQCTADHPGQMESQIELQYRLQPPHDPSHCNRQTSSHFDGHIETQIPHRINSLIALR